MFSPRILDRFYQCYEPGASDACWLWKPLPQSRYGRFSVGTEPERHILLAHRVAWSVHNGAIPDGLCVCHRCDTPRCVNPAHLFLGTVADNNADRANKNRSFRPRRTRKTTAKLTDEKVAQLRALPELTFANAQRIASDWGVSWQHLYRVRRGVQWLSD